MEEMEAVLLLVQVTVVETDNVNLIILANVTMDSLELHAQNKFQQFVKMFNLKDNVDYGLNIVHKNHMKLK
jgi:hypothetical protein